MKQQKKDKTNVMRLLDAAGISYRVQEYEVDENDLSGIHVANQIGEDPDSVFKTLVLKGEKRGYLVCCIQMCIRDRWNLHSQVSGPGYFPYGCEGDR